MQQLTEMQASGCVAPPELGGAPCSLACWNPNSKSSDALNVSLQGLEYFLELF